MEAIARGHGARRRAFAEWGRLMKVGARAQLRGEGWGAGTGTRTRVSGAGRTNLNRSRMPDTRSAGRGAGRARNTRKQARTTPAWKAAVSVCRAQVSEGAARAVRLGEARTEDAT